MPRHRKFSVGPQVTDLHELIRHILAGGWVYWPNNVRPRHPSFMRSQHLNTLVFAVRAGLVHLAIPNPEAVE